jgi:hypothetical protein
MNSSYAADTEADWQAWCPNTVLSGGHASPWSPCGNLDTSTFFDGPTSTDTSAWLCGSHTSQTPPLVSPYSQTDRSNILECWNGSFDPATSAYFGLQRHNSSVSSTNTGSTSYSPGDSFASRVPRKPHDTSAYSLASAGLQWQTLQLYTSLDTTNPMTTEPDLKNSATSDRDFNLSTDPLMEPDASGRWPQRQCPRFIGDEYTPGWIRGDGIHRAGWCKLCERWHKLKDSAYWYHVGGTEPSLRHLILLTR